MIITDMTVLNKFTEDFCKVLEKEEIQYAVVSGFTAISLGRTRGTEDIDIILEKLSFEEFEKLLKIVEEQFECLEEEDPKEMHSRLKEQTNLRFVRKGKLIPNMEIKFAKDELDNLVLKERVKIPEVEADVYFAALESTIAFKELYLRSKKDEEDAQFIREVAKIDEEKVNKYKKMIKTLRL
jgi:hypothetical protein